ncbi:DUF11 domain-containing protein [Leucobacter viscericola]|uniref:DUF11 domain-containing protein n=1 Tax=Leucobacter viscericola TaxID=2714935 RepID=A0A6G7XEN5_9MICO|nr:DUF11 domain-containing protein [Leucobacter viscericola]QIK62909.1 DUF11 domain-containing protein [Leucobacter viscericola]
MEPALRTKASRLTCHVAVLALVAGCLTVGTGPLAFGDSGDTSGTATSESNGSAPPAADAPATTAEPESTPAPTPSPTPNPAPQPDPTPQPKPPADPPPTQNPEPAPQPEPPTTPADPETPATPQAKPKANVPDTGTPSSKLITPLIAVPGSVVDVTINIAGPAAAVVGDTFSYTVTISNNALPVADGAPFSITMPTGATNVAASCGATAGAACPGALNTTDTAVSGSASLLPHLGVLTLTISGVYGAQSPSSVTANAHVDPPAGTTDSDLTSNDSVVGSAINNRADVYVTSSASSTTIAPGSPVTYTVTYGNNGPATVDNPIVGSYLYWDSSLFDSMNIGFVSCAPSGGAICPIFLTNVSQYTNVFNAMGTRMPAGSSVTVVYTADPVLSATPGCGSLTTDVVNDSGITAPYPLVDPNTGNNFSRIFATANGPGECPATDLQVDKTASASTIAPGSPVTYTLTARNNGPIAAGGASLSDYADVNTSLFTGWVYHLVSCTASGGAVCPALNTDSTLGTYDRLINTNIPTFPVGGVITVVYTLDPIPNPTPTCGEAVSVVTNYADLYPQSPLRDSNYSNNYSRPTVTADGPGECPPADLQVTKTQSSSTAMPGAPITYTVTYTNNGPNAAPHPTVSDYYYWDSNLYTGLNFQAVSCTATGGVVCPALVPDGNFNQYNSIFADGQVDNFPSGASFTVAYTLEPLVVNASSCSQSLTTLQGNAGINDYSRTVTDPNSSNNYAYSTATTKCADVSVNKSVAPAAAQAGNPVAFTIRVANGSDVAVNDVAFSDPLPTGFIFTSASCIPNSPASTCGAVTYDPLLRRVSSSISLIGPTQDYVTITVNGTAGTIPGTYKNTATAFPTPGVNDFVDPIIASNTSNVSLQVFNTASTINFTKELTGLPAGGVPVPLTFTGAITCGSQGSKPWSVTLPAGERAIDALTQTFFDGESCTITEDPPPALPAGFGYAGPAVITPQIIPVLGPSQAINVTSRTPLQVLAALQLNKTVSTTKATTGQTVTFTYEVSNGSNVDVTAFEIIERSFSGTGSLSAMNCPSTALPAHTSVVCTANYTITAADVVSGALTNTAYATGTPVSGPDPVSADASARITLVAPPSLTLTKSASVASADQVGQVITYNFAVINNGGVSLTGLNVVEQSFNGIGTLSAVNCPVTALAPGRATSCSANYTVTQADLDRGTTLSNTAVATADAENGFDDPLSEPSTADVDLVRDPSLSVVKSASLSDGAQVLSSGQGVTYSYVVTNTGNVTLDGLTIQERAFSGAGATPTPTCPDVTLAPNDQVICEATYTVTAADVANGQIVNTAVARAVPVSGDPVESESSTVVLPEVPSPELELEKSVSPGSGLFEADTVEYLFTITNTGNVTVDNAGVTEQTFTGSDAIPVPSCAIPPQLIPGQIVTCTAGYTVTAADALAGSFDNTAVATALFRDKPFSSEPSTASATTISPATPGSLAIIKRAAPWDTNKDGLIDPGDTAGWRILVTNTGGTAVSGISIEDPRAVSISCPATSLAPALSMTCTAVGNVITKVGVYENTATARGTTGESAITSAPSTAEFTAVAAPNNGGGGGGGTPPGGGGNGGTAGVVPTTPRGSLASTGGEFGFFVVLGSVFLGIGMLLVRRRRYPVNRAASPRG